MDRRKEKVCVMNRKKIGMVCCVFLLIFQLPISVSAVSMDSDVQFRFEGEVSAPTFPKIEPDKIVEEAVNAIGTIATGKLPQTGEIRSLGIVVLGICLVGFLLFFFYKKNKKSPIDSEVKR